MSTACLVRDTVGIVVLSAIVSHCFRNSMGVMCCPSILNEYLANNNMAFLIHYKWTARSRGKYLHYTQITPEQIYFKLISVALKLVGSLSSGSPVC